MIVDTFEGVTVQAGKVESVDDLSTVVRWTMFNRVGKVENVNDLLTLLRETQYEVGWIRKCRRSVDTFERDTVQCMQGGKQLHLPKE